MIELRAPNRAKTITLQEEFETVMLPRHWQKRGLVSRKNSSAEIPYKRLAPKGTLPGGVDWRGTPATEFVKDQAACGSCWAFAATGALEAAHILATGTVYSLIDPREVFEHWIKQ